ncbi:rubrerythrin-like domain-containing protein [Halorubrum sp. Eb13]|uniref:rubrerythrin-like domain-containing protein n=1 Tax=Halorubrum sp. Eb13 TaxID=1383843 RepID=UPI002AA2A059|nr:rubrerythrin-like domain-containing protein [Halorubrum sp. Eb13]
MISYSLKNNRAEAMLLAIKRVDMRPEYESDGQELYECFECGERTDSGGTCECGGELKHLGRSRDL